ncbi:branched-chain amino acid aminotransferase [Ruania alkalisoli]|uniref:branched-chain-amino-acid transaminase n=1 Tax=Ruania alkalisoli TaxID=2779775 RepID=A0A7M1SPV4_9MICO|nr:branched-chain amino acid aminotransferase [Ruania alkalisoli]QOR69570.1 branched-chain amino acid aminotransferase [Ruania alkalisoli]
MSTIPDGAPHFPVQPNLSPFPAEERRQAVLAPRFGTCFTDHMARAHWSPQTGWTDHRVVPYAPLAMDPAAAVLHYGQEIFEGLKAYRHADGSVWAFRPELNAARFAASARRLALPELPEADFLASLEALVRTDRAWVPAGAGASLYLRPFMFASEAFLGVRPAAGVDYLVIASPAGGYFTAGFAPVSIWVARDQHRAGPGGTGAAKTGGNYAASLLPQQQAREHGCDQVCFLDAATSTALEEIGSMNVLLVMGDGSVHTPALTGTILAGVTRRSVLDLLAQDGREVVERTITLAEVLDGLRRGTVTEVLACGTAAVITPIGRLAGEGFDVTVADGAPGPVTTELHERLTGIQYGRCDDTYRWLHRLA